MTERWLPIVGYEGVYSVSDHGSVRSEERVVKHSRGGDRRCRARVLKAGRSAGYSCVTLYRNGRASKRRIQCRICNVERARDRRLRRAA